MLAKGVPKRVEIAESPRRRPRASRSTGKLACRAAIVNQVPSSLLDCSCASKESQLLLHQCTLSSACTRLRPQNSYEMSDAKKAAMKKAAEQTLARVTAIRKHLDTAPRGGRLQGKVAIVTGANSLTGIGRATARLFAHEGGSERAASAVAEGANSPLSSDLRAVCSQLSHRRQAPVLLRFCR